MKIIIMRKILFCAGLSLISLTTVKAQFSLTGQLRTRTELRAGQGTLQQKGDVPALFTSQRTRVNFSYKMYRLKFFSALQDVRVWGQDAATNNRVTSESLNGLMLHEAWAEINLNDTISSIENLSLKIGRQEIMYDDSRLLGNLDWLQQARRHDAAVLKFSNKGWVADLGVVFNQNKELNTNTLYNGVPALYPAGTNGIGTMYKSFQYLYLGRKFYFGSGSLLLFKDDFNKYVPDGPGKITYQRGVWSRYTSGAYLNATILRKFNVTGSYYLQFGKNKDGRDIQAYSACLYTSYQVTRLLSVGPGFDMLSGEDPTKTVTATSKDHCFDPLYGTPHKFWGYMDYFYVASPFGKGGLADYFLKSKYKLQDNLALGLDYHQFYSANKVTDASKAELNRNLGSEIDLTMAYNLTKNIQFELGYSSFFATSTLASPNVKNVKNANLNGNWVYLMINIKPEFLK